MGLTDAIKILSRPREMEFPAKTTFLTHGPWQTNPLARKVDYYMYAGIWKQLKRRKIIKILGTRHNKGGWARSCGAASIRKGALNRHLYFCPKEENGEYPCTQWAPHPYIHLHCFWLTANLYCTCPSALLLSSTEFPKEASSFFQQAHKNKHNNTET